MQSKLIPVVFAALVAFGASACAVDPSDEEQGTTAQNLGSSKGKDEGARGDGKEPSKDEGKVPSKDEGKEPSKDEGKVPSKDEGKEPSKDDGSGDKKPW